MRPYTFALRISAAAAIAIAAIPAAPGAQENGQPAEEKAERPVCRAVEGATGSRLGGERVCRTREQWRQIERDNRRGAAEQRDREDR